MDLNDLKWFDPCGHWQTDINSHPTTGVTGASAFASEQNASGFLRYQAVSRRPGRC